MTRETAMTSGDSPWSERARAHNRRAWNALVEKKQRFTTPAADDQVGTPLANVDAAGWLPASIAGRRMLCLGAGGGRQSAIYAAAGAVVTVVDISSEMLALDRQVAAERGLDVRAVEASMDDLSMLPAAEFEIIVQPVSTCYVPDIVAVYREVARVAADGALYISQHKQPSSLQGGLQPTPSGYELLEPYYRTGPLPPSPRSQHREEGTLEFLHRWEDLIGGLCRAGFVLEDLIEPLHATPDAALGTFAHRSAYLPPYVRLKARRRPRHGDEPPTAGAAARLWTPDET